MKRVFVVVVLSVLLTACGGGNGPGEPRVSIASGNWSFEASSVSSTGRLVIFGGGLAQSGSTLSGLVQVGFSECFNPFTAFNVTGEVSGSSFTMKTDAVENQVVTIKGTISGPKTLIGTYSIAGGCAGGDQGSIVGTYVPPLTGTWKATEDINGSQVEVTLDLTQSGTVSSQGNFQISGTAQYTGSPCVFSGTTDPNLSFISGNLVGIKLNTSEAGGGIGQVLYVGLLDDPATATSFDAFETVLMGTCTSSGQLITFTKK